MGQLSQEMAAARSSLAQRLEANKTQTDDAKKLTLDDELAIIDRMTKIELLEHKLGSGKAGSRLDDEDDEE